MTSLKIGDLYELTLIHRMLITMQLHVLPICKNIDRDCSEQIDGYDKHILCACWGKPIKTPTLMCLHG